MQGQIGSAFPIEESDNNMEGLDLELDPAVLDFVDTYDELPDTSIVPMVSPRLLDHNAKGDKVVTGSEKKQDSRLLPRKKSWHQRRREEIVRLREVVKELSAVLRHERTNASCKTALPVSSSQVSAAGARATRELMLLQQSTENNGKLRGLARFRELHIKSMERALKRRTRALTPVIRSSGRPVFNPSMFSKDILSELTVGMDEVHADLDNFLTRVKMHELPCPGLRNDATKDRDRNVFVELLNCYAVPFDLRDTEKAIWALKTTPAGDLNVKFAQCADLGDNTRLKSICVGESRHGVAFHIVVHVAARKYVEKDRIVFIWRVLVDPIQEFVGVVFKETTRLVLKLGNPSATGPTTVIQTHCRVTEYAKGDQLKGFTEWKATPDYEIAARAWEHSITGFNHKVEDMLLRESLHC
ncbi:hypothetical protein PHYPSEUDO_012039 [Phytophthora pseudosyringae]|uniref:M96 mating-specific protein family n=1 Tax=Phytophthora pseudosyringae TaxID=221518 RepID=A0A8T1V7C9_9STRA|nr:hypothetical protein PHYPSEUDO_012039 [Phytophthora pseudosyringae]